MGNLSDLRAKAITSAKSGDWQAAADYNAEILSINTADIAALNRLGMAQIQLSLLEDARQTFERVLVIDGTNVIAKKQLHRLDSNEAFVPPTFTADAFIEEPGKAKLCHLHRLAGKDVLMTLSVGQHCLLKPKSRFISVETMDGQYVGSLPDDISFRITKLISSGNTYEVLIHTVNKMECAVFIKETRRAKENQAISSFPLGLSTTTISDDGDPESTIFMDEEDQENRYVTTEKEQKEDAEEEFAEESGGFTDEDIERLQ